MDDKTTYSIVAIRPLSPAAEDLISFFRGLPDCEIVEVDGFAAAPSTIRNVTPCIVVSSINEVPNVAATVDLLKRINLKQNHELIKSIIIAKPGFAAIRDVFRALHVSDFIVEPVSARTLAFKGQLQLKTIKSAEEKRKRESKQLTSKKFHADEKQEDNSLFSFAKKKVTKVKEKFVIEVKGPKPTEGQWKQLGTTADGEKKWGWESKKSDGTTELTEWNATGEEPVFNEETNSWEITSDSPTLTAPDASEIKGDEAAAAVFNTLPASAENSDDPVAKALAAAAAAQELARTKAKNKPGSETPAATFNNATGAQAQPAHHAARADKTGAGSPEPSAAVAAAKTTAEAEAAAFRDKSATGAAAEATAVRNLIEREEQAPAAAIPAATESAPEAAAPLGVKPAQKESVLAARLKEIARKRAEQEKAQASASAGAAEAKPAAKGRAPHARVAQALGAITKKQLEHAAAVKAAGAKLKDEPEPSEIEARNARAHQTADESSEERAQAAKTETDAAKERLKRARAKLGDKSPAELLELSEEEELAESAEAAEGSETQTESEEEETGGSTLKRKRRKGKDKAKRTGAAGVEAGEEEFSDEEESDQAESEEEADFNIDLSIGGATNTRSEAQAGGSNATSHKRRAHDGDDGETEVDWRALNAGQVQGDKRPTYFYRDRHAISVVPGKWVRAGDHFFFLRDLVARNKIKVLQEALPLWIYQGEKAPLFESNGQRWRFENSEPTQAITTTELPSPVLRELQRYLKEASKQTIGSQAEEIAGHFSKAHDPRAEAEAEAEADAVAETAAEDSDSREIAAKKKQEEEELASAGSDSEKSGRKKRGEKQRVDSLTDILDDSGSAELPELEAAETHGDDDGALDAGSRSRKSARQQPGELPELEAERAELEDEDFSEIAELQRKRKASEDSSELEQESLRGRAGKEEADALDPEKSEPQAQDSAEATAAEGQSSLQKTLARLRLMRKKPRALEELEEELLISAPEAKESAAEEDSSDPSAKVAATEEESAAKAKAKAQAEVLEGQVPASRGSGIAEESDLETSSSLEEDAAGVSAAEDSLSDGNVRSTETPLDLAKARNAAMEESESGAAKVKEPLDLASIVTDALASAREAQRAGKVESPEKDPKQVPEVSLNPAETAAQKNVPATAVMPISNEKIASTAAPGPAAIDQSQNVITKLDQLFPVPGYEFGTTDSSHKSPANQFAKILAEQSLGAANAAARTQLNRLTIAQAIAKAIKDGTPQSAAAPVTRSGSQIALELAMAQISRKNAGQGQATKVIMDFCQQLLPQCRAEIVPANVMEDSRRFKLFRENKATLRQVTSSDQTIFVWIEAKNQATGLSSQELAQIDRLGKPHSEAIWAQSA